ncbi:hypothetical protein B0A55_06361 [Friedmanniomyces simplex]|uniref:Spindle pole body component n=1 Tax=Friedmanniomyces simplex TaxID=329884 RepID=A0A4U0X6M0_9PEZI|nr:hypothetical protein B0A55_06361 [Friedmanniomyces simplex]
MGKYNPFAVDDLWRHSPLQLLSGKASCFELPVFDLPELDDERADAILLVDTLHLPELAARDGDDHRLAFEDFDIPSTPEDFRPAPTENKQPEVQLDIWSLDLDRVGETSTTRFHTWEAFEKKDVSNATRTAHLSEAGPGVFDAALSLEKRHNSIGVLPRDVSLRALCTLALGRSSIFFQWDEIKQSFTQTLRGTPTAGLSAMTSDSFTTELMDYAAMYHKLQTFSAADLPRESLLAVGLAFRRSMSSVLEAIEENIVTQMSSIRSLLQLQAIVERPRRLLSLLDALKDAISDSATDEAAIASLSDTVHAIAATGNSFAAVLKAVLEQASRPWLEKMATELGLTHQAWPSSQPADGSSGEGRAFEASVASDCTAKSQGDSLLTAEDKIMVSETQATVSLLRIYLPDAVQPADEPVELSDVRLCNREAPFQKHHSQTRSQRAISDLSSGAQLQFTLYEQDVWASHEAQQHFYGAIDQQMSAEPSALRMNNRDSVYLTAVKALAEIDDRALLHGNGLSLKHFQRPFDKLRPDIEAQACRMNRVLLRYLFRDCGLRKHLELQCTFHLLYSGEFVSRLSTALFSAETQSAERKRGMIPTAETMGLRLGVKEGQRWPPASSELRLTLAGLLSEVHHDSSATPKQAKAQGDLPGGLSFAIRELPEAEIDLVMDTGSIYALDFLRLQYTAPPPLDSILTPSSMQKYDDTFRFLLRMVRAVYITARLGQGTTEHRHCARDSSTARFVIEAHHVTTTLMSYFIDVGISAPWTALQAALDGVEKALEDDTAVVVGVSVLRDMHRDLLGTVRERLFLKRKQQAIRVAIEEVLTAVLNGAASMQSDDEGGPHSIAAEHAAFGVAVVKLIGILQRIVDKPPKSHVSSDGDVDVVRLLLAKLDWNGFYASKAPT